MRPRIFGRLKSGRLCCHLRGTDGPSIPFDRAAEFQFLPRERCADESEKSNGNSKLNWSSGIREEELKVIHIDPSSMSEVHDFVEESKYCARHSSPMPGASFCSKVCCSVGV